MISAAAGLASARTAWINDESFHNACFGVQRWARRFTIFLFSKVQVSSGVLLWIGSEPRGEAIYLASSGEKSPRSLSWIAFRSSHSALRSLLCAKGSSPFARPLSWGRSAYSAAKFSFKSKSSLSKTYRYWFDRVIWRLGVLAPNSASRKRSYRSHTQSVSRWFAWLNQQWHHSCQNHAAFKSQYAAVFSDHYCANQYQWLYGLGIAPRSAYFMKWPPSEVNYRINSAHTALV